MRATASVTAAPSVTSNGAVSTNAPVGAQPLGAHVQLRGIAPVEHDACAGAGQPAGQRVADAELDPGDQRGATRQVENS
jgi:hypothetical protein